MGASKSKVPIIISSNSKIMTMELNLPNKDSIEKQISDKFSSSPSLIQQFFLDQLSSNGIAETGMTVYFEPTYKSLLNLRLSHIYLRKALLKDLMNSDDLPEQVSIVTVDATQNEGLYALLAQWSFSLQRTITH